MKAGKFFYFTLLMYEYMFNRIPLLVKFLYTLIILYEYEQLATVQFNNSHIMGHESRYYIFYPLSNIAAL